MEKSDLITIAALGVAAYIFMPKNEGSSLGGKGGLGDTSGGLPPYASNQGGGGAESPIVIMDFPEQRDFNPEPAPTPTPPEDTKLPPWEESGIVEGTGTKTKKEAAMTDYLTVDNVLTAVFAASAAKSGYDWLKEKTKKESKLPEKTGKLGNILKNIGKGAIIGAAGYIAGQAADKNLERLEGRGLEEIKKDNPIASFIGSILPKPAAAAANQSYSEGAPFYKKGSTGLYQKTFMPPGKGQMELSKKQMVSGSQGSPSFGTQNVPSWTSSKIKDAVSKYGSTRYSNPNK